MDELKGTYSISPLTTGLKRNKLPPNTKGSKYGAGLRDPDEELPVYAQFGNILIMLRKLYYKNILSVKKPSLHSIDGLNNCKVSNLFVDIIMDMYDNKNVENFINALSSTEKKLLNLILFRAGLHKKVKANIHSDLEDLKNRFKIVEGEIMAGNNNPEVVKELKSILTSIHHLGGISYKGAQKYLSQFKN